MAYINVYTVKCCSLQVGESCMHVDLFARSVRVRSYGCQAKFINKLTALEPDKSNTADTYGNPAVYCFNEEPEKAEEVY